jgi:hypothetical protein
MHPLVLALRTPYRSIAAITALALLAWTLGLPAWIHRAEAAGLQDISDVISDSDLGVNAAHRITFTTPNGMTGQASSQENLRFTFDPTNSFFDTTGFTSADISIVSGATKVTNAGACPGSGDSVYFTVGAGDYYDMTVCASNSIGSSTTLVIDFGTTTAGNLINNPATSTSYVVQIAGYDLGAGSTAAPDSGDTRVAIIDDVTVTAAVNTIFTFTVNGVNPGVTVNDDVTTTSGTSTATSVPFGTIAPGVPKLLAQRLTVDTNALNGFSVTVQADQTLTAGNNATIDTFIDGADTASSTVWQGPTGTVGSTNTYGHWGVTSDDDVVSGIAAHWGTNKAQYEGDFVQNPIEVFYNNQATLSTAGQGVGSTTVAYKVEITALQEAAKDYTATLTYIATPVF